MVEVSGETTQSQETQQYASIDETLETESTPQSPTYNPAGDEQQVHSPFTMYLNRVQTPAVTTPAEPEIGRASAHTLPAADPPTNFVTSSDLEALERRFQVLVSEATASISTQLQGRVSTSTELRPQPTSSRLPVDRIPEPPTFSGATTTRVQPCYPTYPTTRGTFGNCWE